MAETVLFTISDVQAIRHIDPKFNAAKFAAFAFEVQRVNLRELLGASLYLDLFNNTANYADLINGKEFTYNNELIKFYGLKPLLSYWWLAIAVREGELYLSNYGAVQFVNNQQQSFESAKEKERIATGYMSTAQGYANDVIKFLNANTSTYSKWKGNTETSGTQFFSFKL